MTARQFGNGLRGTARQDPQFYSWVQDEGVVLPQELILNFVGGGVTAADDAANGRTNVTIPLGAGLNAPTTPAEDNMVAWGDNGNLEYGPQIFTDGTYLGAGGALAALPGTGAFRMPSLGSFVGLDTTGLLDVPLVTLDANDYVVIGGTNALGIDQNINDEVLHQLRGDSTTGTSNIVASEVGDNTTSGAVTATLAELAIPDGYFGLVTIDITCEEDGTPANSYVVQNTYAVSGEGGAATIRDATAVPLELDAGAVGMSFAFNTNGQNVRVQGVGVAGVDLIWSCHIGGLLHER